MRGYTDTPSGGGSGGVNVAIAQKSDATKGVEIALAEDATWKMDGIQRATGTRATVEIPGPLLELGLPSTHQRSSLRIMTSNMSWQTTGS